MNGSSPEWTARLSLLSPKEKLGLCRVVASAAVGRLRALAQGTDPEDLALRGLLEKLGGAEEERRRTIEAIDARLDGPPLLSETSGRDLLREIFTSLESLPVDAFVGREAGTYWAECLAEESARFYGALADQATDRESRALFLRWEEESRLALAFLRKVLL